MIDYIIVGCGIAGISFAETCVQNGKSVMVFDSAFQNASKIAGGLYNPVILKRFSGLKDAQKQIHLLNDFYAKIENKLQVKFDYKVPILRKFFSIEEQNNWFAAADKVDVEPFLSLKIIDKKYSGIESPFNYGKVLQTGYVDTTVYLNSYKKYLQNLSKLVEVPFEYSKLKITSAEIEYKNIKSTNIVFAEGFGLHANPYFNHLPLDGTKGELFIIKAPLLDLDVVINTSVFIIPLGNNLFKVGATYNWEDKTNLPTEAGKAELLNKIEEIIKCDFEIISHFAGVRPTVKDRKPLLGTHSDFGNVHILNGLGTRGIMLGPTMAKILFEHIEFGKPLEKDVDIKRFDKKK